MFRASQVVHGAWFLPDHSASPWNNNKTLKTLTLARTCSLNPSLSCLSPKAASPLSPTNRTDHATGVDAIITSRASDRPISGSSAGRAPPQSAAPGLNSAPRAGPARARMRRGGAQGGDARDLKSWAFSMHQGIKYLRIVHIPYRSSTILKKAVVRQPFLSNNRHFF